MSLTEMKYWDEIFEKIENGEFFDVHADGLYTEIEVLNGKVLDIGCGTMDYLSYIKQSDSNYLVALDFSKKALKLAKENIKGKNIALVRARADKLPFKNNVFDQVLCIELIPHTVDYNRVIKEIQRTLNQNTVLTFHHKDDALKSNLTQVGDNIFEDEGKKYTYFDEYEVSTMLQKVGFHNIKTKILTLGDIYQIPRYMLWPSCLPPRNTKAVIQTQCIK